MCVKNIFYNTYADGAQDVTEEVYPCREGRVSHVPEVHKYNRKLPFGKGTHFLGDLPTPRSSKSPSPNRRSSTYIPGSGLADIPKSSKHHSHYDRHDHRRRSSRHFDSERDIPSEAILTRSMTSPHVPHYVVIDQDQSRFKHLDIPMGPVHVIDGHGGHRRKTSKDSRDHESSGPHLQRRHSVNQQGYVVVNDNREHRRHERRERRMSTSDAIPIPPAAPAAPDIHPGSPRRLGRRATTVVHSSSSSNATSSSDSSPSKHVRWEEKMRLARERHNAEIAKRDAPADSSSPLKGILKNTTIVEPKPKDRESSAEAKERRRARKVKREEELDLFDHDRLRARFGSEEEGDRDRRRRSKVWLAGDRYQYL